MSRRFQNEGSGTPIATSYISGNIMKNNSFEECTRMPEPGTDVGYRDSILDQESFSDTLRLRTIVSIVESGSTQKYPCRSNW